MRCWKTESGEFLVELGGSRFDEYLLLDAGLTTKRRFSGSEGSADDGIYTRIYRVDADCFVQINKTVYTDDGEVSETQRTLQKGLTPTDEQRHAIESAVAAHRQVERDRRA